jgi:hypothetical protein
MLKKMIRFGALLVAALYLATASFAANPSATLMTNPLYVEFDNNGNPLAGGMLYTYYAGTNVPLATFTDATLLYPNPNPVILDQYGKAQVWFSNNAYKVNLTDALGVQQPDYPVDNLRINTVSGTSLAALPGAGLVGYSYSQSYPSNTVGTALQAFSSATTGAGASLVGYLAPYTGSVARTVSGKESDTVCAIDFGADPTGVKDSSAAFVAASLTLKRIYIPAGTYKCNAKFTVNIVAYGDGPLQTIIKPNLLTSAAFTLANISSNQTVWTISNVISDMTFEDPGTQTGIGIACVAIAPSASYIVGDESVSVGTLRNVNFINLNKGIALPYGNIGGWFHDCSWIGCYYGIYNLDNKYSSTVQMPVSCKYFYGGNFSNNICAIYLDNATSGAGGYEFYGTVIENNFIAMRFNNLGVMSHPIIFNGVWFEQNGSASYTGTNLIDVWTGTSVVATATSPLQFICSGQNLSINFKDSSTVGDIGLTATNSLVVVDGCDVDGATISVSDSGSQVRIKNSNHLGTIISNNGVTWDDPPFDIWQNVLGQGSPASTQFSWISPKRSVTVGADGTNLMSLDMAWLTHTTAGIVGTSAIVGDGVLWGSCNQMTVPFTGSGQLSRIPDTSIHTGTTTGNTYMVVMADVKVNSGTIPTFLIQNENSGIQLMNISVPTLGVWYTIATLATIPPAGIPNTGSGVQYLDVQSKASGTVVYSISGFQAVQFITKEAALNFLRKKVYVLTQAAFPTVASSATIYPAGPIFYVSGTSAIATIAPPFASFIGSITIIPLGAFTTNYSGNMALSSTAVAGRSLIMTYDPNVSKWYPSY